MITLNKIKQELVEGIETERILKEFRKLNEYNAIMFEINTQDGISWVDKLIMFNPKFYSCLKKVHKTEERLLKVLEQNPAYFKELKFDGTFSEQFIKDLLDTNNKFFDYAQASDSIKESREILSHVLNTKKIYLTEFTLNMVKNDIELYTKYLGLMYNYELYNSGKAQNRWGYLLKWSSSFHGKEKPLLKKTENLEYFLKHYKGFYPKSLLILMCSNKTFQEKINEIVDIKNIPNEEVKDYASEIRQISILEKIKEHDKTVEVAKVEKVKKKI